MRRVNIAILTAVMAASGLFAETEKAKDSTPKDKTQNKQESKAKAEKDEVLTFTTLDFERKYGPSPRALPKTETKPDDDGKPPADDPLAAMLAKRDADRDRAAKITQATQRVQKLQLEIASMEKSLAQLRNPLLGRAQPAEDDAKAWKDADQGERQTLTQERLASVRKELAQAQKELNGVR
jgi:hypothetical protein